MNQLENIKTSNAVVGGKSTTVADIVKDAILDGGLKTKRNPYWCLTTSSYDRGNQHLLEMWPDIKKAVPQAELHIAYGWQLFDKFYSDNPSSMAWKSRMEEMMKADGITHHGRLSQPEIMKWYKKCGLWTYPTHFGEINCISALKAQCWGAVPVIVNYAALKTSVKWGKKVEGDIYEPETKEAYKKALIKALTDHEWQEKVRAEMMPEAQKLFSWEVTAKKWNEEFCDSGKGKGHTGGFRKGYLPWNKGKNDWGDILVCPWCKKSFRAKKYRVNRAKNVCCSKECSYRLRDNGKTKESKRIRQRVGWKKWRESIFRRDNFTCLHCGKRGGKLHPHHIIPLAVNKKLAYSVSNGMTLCVDCHRKTSSYGNASVAKQWSKEFEGVNNG